MPIALDGSATTSAQVLNSATVATGTLTTTINGDVLVLIVGIRRGNSSSISVSSVSGGGLTWAQRGVSHGVSNSIYNATEVWYAKTAPGSTFSSAVTATLSQSTSLGAYAVAFGVSGADTTNIWDTDGSLPGAKVASSNTLPGSASFSTANANTMIIGALTSNDSSARGDPTGYTQLSEQNSGSGTIMLFETEYQVVSTAQSSGSFSWGGGNSNSWCSYVDAIRAAPSTLSTPLRRIVYRR